MTRKSEISLHIFCCLTCLLLSFAECPAQESPPDLGHWAYSPFFGSGWYQIRDTRDVYVIRATPRWEIREANFAENEIRTIGIEFRFPITFGLDRFSFDDLPGSIDLDNLTSMSVTPGVEITIPINERWWLRPHAAVGWGSTFNSSDSAWTYWAGIKSRYSFQHGKLDWALLNSVTYVGATPNRGSSESFWPLMAGLEFDYPLGARKLGGEQVFLSWHGMYTTFENELEDVIGDVTIEPINDQWEFGLSFRKEKSRIKILFMKFDRLGLAYRFSTSGDFEGISFVFHSVFDR